MRRLAFALLLCGCTVAPYVDEHGADRLDVIYTVSGMLAYDEPTRLRQSQRLADAACDKSRRQAHRTGAHANSDRAWYEYECR